MYHLPVTLALQPLGQIAIFLGVFGTLMLFAAMLTRVADRAGIPVVLLFLVLGLIGGSEGLGGIEFDDPRVAFHIGTVALILILFDGGLNTRWAAVRSAAVPATLLATIGVVGTAGLVAAFGRLLGLQWPEAVLVGAIVSSTDAAAVFAVLRGGGIKLDESLRSTIEVESCVNDPMAVILTLAAIEVITTGTPPGWHLLLTVPAQLALGGAAGAAVGLGARAVLARAHLSAAGLYPVLTLGVAFIAFGFGTVVGGSGFLAVFVAAAVVGNGRAPYKTGLRRVHDAVAWLSQVGMFLMLGLLAFPSQLLPVAGIGLALGLLLAVVARPLVVIACLLPLRWTFARSLVVGWVGLRGAVPIVLATFPMMAAVPGADRVFHTVFFVVVVSTIIPGASILPFVQRLKLGQRAERAPTASLELHSLKPIEEDLRLYVVTPDVAASGARVADLPFPEGAAIVLIVRDDHPLAARGSTVLTPGDHVYVAANARDEPLIGLFLGRSIP